MLESYIGCEYSLNTNTITLTYKNEPELEHKLVSELNSDTVEFDIRLYIITNYFNEGTYGYVKQGIEKYTFEKGEELKLNIRFKNLLEPKPIKDIKISKGFEYFKEEDIECFYKIKTMSDLWDFETEFCWLVGKSISSRTDFILRKGKKKIKLVDFSMLCIEKDLYIPNGVLKRIYKDVQFGSFRDLLNHKWFCCAIGNSANEKAFYQHLNHEVLHNYNRFKEFIKNYPIVEEL